MPSRLNNIRQSSRYADPTPSRRASRVDVRRDGAGDVIEEDDAMGRHQGSSSSQRLEEEEEDQPSSSATSLSNRGRTGGHSEGTAAPQRHQDPPPQPLTIDSVPLIKPSVRAWAEAGERVATIKDHLKNTAVTHAEYNEDQAEEKLDEIERGFKELVDMSIEAQIRRKVMDDLVKAISRGEEITDAKGQYEERVEQSLQEYLAKTQRQKYMGDESYKDFKEATWDAWKEEAMPPLSHFLPAEEGDEDDEDEFTIGGVRVEYKCPLTMALLDQPMTNPACKHSYSRAAVVEYIATQRRQHERPVCPRSGCDKILHENTLKEDKEMEKKVKIFKRRMEMRSDSRRSQATQIVD